MTPRASRKQVYARRMAVLAFGPELPPLMEIVGRLHKSHGTTADTLDKDLRWLRNQGHVLNAPRSEGTRKPLGKTEIADARRLAKAGLTIAEISHHLCRSQSAIRHVCKGVLDPREMTVLQGYTTISHYCISTTYSDTKRRARAFQKDLTLACRGKSSKTPNRAGVTPEMESAYAAALWASLGGKMARVA